MSVRRHPPVFVAFVIAACWTLLWGGPQSVQALPPGADGPSTRCKTAVCLEAMYAIARRDFSTAAKKLEQHLRAQRIGDIAPSTYGDLLVLGAHAFEKSGAPESAAQHWIRASELADHLDHYFKYRALRALLGGDDPPTKWIRELADDTNVDGNYPDAPLTRVRLNHVLSDGLPEASVIRASLEGSTREDACRWLGEHLDTKDDRATEQQTRRRAARNLWWGYCPDVDEADAELPDDFEPTDEARFQRAEKLFFAVEYESALRELRAADFSALPDKEMRCRARFRLARTYYRMDRDGPAQKAYRKVVDSCDDEATATPRVRSLYAIGRHNYFRSQLDASRKAYRRMLKEYPERSHADDALLFLGRIARDRGNRGRARELLERALREYPDGDMVHEMAWEFLEPTFKDGEYETFERILTDLQLPDRDDQYFSQGRLAYFLGLARQRSGNQSGAVEAWQRAWSRYPFSFYGYMAHLKIREAGKTPASLQDSEEPEPADWFVDSDWHGAGVRRLLALDLDPMAVDVERARMATRESVTDRDWWRLAALHARAHDHHASHEIPRRQIDAPPWVNPSAGRMDRWRIAFPNPYGAPITRAVRAEADQAGSDHVPTGLVRSIIREESGFRPEVVSWAGAVGLMQLMPTTAKHHDDDIDGESSVERLKKPELNIRIGVDHLFFLADRLDNHPVAMVAAYNAGVGAVGSWLDGTDDVAVWVEDIPYRQARHYSKHVIGTWAAYQWLDGRRRLADSAGAALPKN